jgi:hypothetical protein
MKWTRRIFLGLIILAGLITALWWEENWRGQKIWEESCARLRAAGEPVDIADIIPPMIPDAENVAAAPIFAEVFTDEKSARLKDRALRSGYTPKGAVDAIYEPKDRPISLEADDPLAREWRDYIKGCLPNHAPIPEGLSPAEETLFLLHHYDEVWEDISEAVRRPRCRWPLDYNNYVTMKSPHFDVLSGTMAIAKPRVIAYAAKGDAEKWTRSVLTLLRLARHYDEGSTNILSHMMGFANEGIMLRLWQNTLEGMEFREDHLLELQRQVSRISLTSTLRGIQQQRITTVTEMRSLKVNQVAGFLSDDWGAILGNHAGDWKPQLQATLILSRPRGWQLAELAAFQNSFHDGIQAAVIDNSRALEVKHIKEISRAGEYMREHPRFLSLDAVVSLSHGMSGSLVEKACRRLAYARCAEAWCAVERYRLRHGRIPQTLQYLLPDFLDELPVDPINGGALRYLRKGDGSYLIYSIGWNELDDGGRGSRREELDWVWTSNPARLEEGVVSNGSTRETDSSSEK